MLRSAALALSLLVPADPAGGEDVAPTPSPAAPLPVQDQDDDEPDLRERVERLEERNAELERRLDVVGREYERFQLGELVPPVGEGRAGMGPAASKIYAKDQGLSIGGYGETLLQWFSGEDESDTFDFLRLVLYFGYKFDERWVLNTELEFEHASTGEEGSVSVEFAYLDYLCSEELNARIGLVLLPMGFLNELHEPTTFLGATRPETEQRILPSTWRENGVGVYGNVSGFDYRAYVVNGLDASGFSASGLRGGRQKGSEALAEDLAFVARLDWVDTPGLVVGASAYHGDSGQEQDAAGIPDATTTIWEAHAEVKSGGLWARALVASADVDDVDELNAGLGLAGDESVGEELVGAYVEAGYDVMALIDPESEASVLPFVRWESIDTQSDVPAGFSTDPLRDEDILTVGVHVRPIPQLVFKLEVQDWEDAPDRVNGGMGYVF